MKPRGKDGGRRNLGGRWVWEPHMSPEGCSKELLFCLEVFSLGP
jgi:hypothetical protein